MKKTCVECSSNLNDTALKCPHCGSYQNWRRFLPFGESTLALTLSVIALTAVVLPNPKTIVKSASDYISGVNFALSGAVINIGVNEVSVLVKNRENEPVAIDEVACLLNIPIDPSVRLTEFFKNRAEGIIENKEAPLLNSETMGVFQFAFRLTTPALLTEFGSKIITLPVQSISPPLRSSTDLNSSDTVVNFCMVIGTSLRNNNASGAILLTPLQVNDIDLLDVLEISLYPPNAEQERETDLLKVRTTRNSSSEAE